MVNEAETGYICRFKVCWGKDSKHDDSDCTKTTSTVKEDLLRSINSLETSLEVVLSQPFVIVCNATIMKYYMLPRKTEVSL